MNNYEWVMKPKDELDPKRIEHIEKEFHTSKLVSKIIASKKLNDKDYTDEDIRKFLQPTRHDFYDPYKLPDMKKAVKRILKAIDDKEQILIYGDYDADGITSTTVLKRFFKDIGISVNTYLPNRIKEGYGLNDGAVKKIADEKNNLIITVDCGITATKETEEAKKLGIDMIITDHHEPGKEIPKAIAVVDAKREDSKYPFRELCGCGIAFKLIQALSQELGIDENDYLKYLDIVAIGTISDIVPLVDENRVIAKLGLMLLRQTRNVGLRELLKIIRFKEIDSTTVSYGLAPRINACGRMGKQEIALELFTTDDPIEAKKLAKQMEEYNQLRQTIEKKITEEAITKFEKENNKSILVDGNVGWHSGVIGIVASKVTEKFNKPSILCEFVDGKAKGSGRSVDGFDIHKALEECSEFLENYGGHAKAGGLTLKEEDFEKFKKQIEEYTAKNLVPAEPKLYIDEELTAQDIEVDNIRQLELLKPFGEENKELVIIYKNLKIKGIRTLTEGKHIKLILEDGNKTIDCIGFNLGELAGQFHLEDHVDVVGNININSFNNIDKVQINLIDMRSSVK